MSTKTKHKHHHQRHRNAKATHPLSRAHMKRIVIRRSDEDRKALRNIVGITWNLRGKTVLPLGKASMLVMSYHPGTDGHKQSIESRCVTSQLDPITGEIHWSNVVMSHDFSFTPFPGARGRIMDPRNHSNNPDDKPNGDWVNLNLALESSNLRAAKSNWLLPAVPQFPDNWCGFRSMGEIDMTITPALLELIATQTGLPLAKLHELPTDDLNMMAKAHWPDLWMAPGTGINTTKFWWIEMKYVAPNKRRNSHISHVANSNMIGIDTWNPARDIVEDGIIAFDVANPILAVAKRHAVDLRKFYDVMTTLSERADDPAHDADVERVGRELALLNAGMREALGNYATDIRDGELLDYILDPSKIIRVERTPETLDVADAMKLMRLKQQQSRPLFVIGTTDEDLANAWANPRKPLYASKVAKFQNIICDLNLPETERFQYKLGDDVYANLWKVFQPRNRKGSHGCSQQVAATVGVSDRVDTPPIGLDTEDDTAMASVSANDSGSGDC